MPRKQRFESETDQADVAVQVISVGSLSPLIDEIRYWHRRRCFAMDTRKAMDQRLLSLIKVAFGWTPNLPKAERDAIAERAEETINRGEGEFAKVIELTHQAREPFDLIEGEALERMTALAEQLPAWQSFGLGVRGFGAPSLAVIVGEAGDLSIYDNPSKIWKRMGLAVFNGKRQGGLPKGAPKEEWIAHGYSRQRRSRMWVIGDTLIKGNRDGIYRRVYLERKAYEIARDPDIKPIKAHRRAQRYMEKRLLRDLWQAWRRAINSLTPEATMPAADHLHAGQPAGGGAIDHVATNSKLPLPRKRQARDRKTPVATLLDASKSVAAKAARRRTLDDKVPVLEMSDATKSKKAAKSRQARGHATIGTHPLCASRPQSQKAGKPARRSAKSVLKPVKLVPTAAPPKPVRRPRAARHSLSPVVEVPRVNSKHRNGHARP